MPESQRLLLDFRLNWWLVVLLLLVIVSFSTCSRRQDPQGAYDHAWDAFQRGDLERADQEAASGYNRFHSLGPEWAWTFAILRARILCQRGLNRDALNVLSAETAAGPSGELAVQKSRFEGLAYASLGDYPAADRELDHADRLCAAAHYPGCADVVGARGMLEMARRNYKRGQELFERVLVRAKAADERIWEAETLLNLSWAADEQTHYDEALDWARAASAIALSTGVSDVAQKALGNMGWAFYKLGDREKAEGMFVEARKQAEKLGSITDRITWLVAFAYVCLDEGKISDAEQSAEQSLDLARKTNSPKDIVDSLIVLSVVSEQADKLDKAKQYADEALVMERSDGTGHDVVYPLLVEGRLAVLRNDMATGESDFREVERSKDAPVFLKWEAERALAHLYEDENHPDPADAEYRAALNTFEAARCDIHEYVERRLPFLSNAARIYEDYIHFLVAQNKTNEALQVADYMRARTLTEGLGRACKAKFAPDPLNAPEIARRAGGTILFYALGQQHSYLWAITPHQVKMFPLAANQPEIDTAVQSYRKKLEGLPGLLKTSNEYGSRLYQMLVAPAQDFLNKEPSAKNIFIIPDGGLNSLNFETLLPQSQQLQHYWIEDVTITDSPSLSLLRVSHNRSLTGKLLLIGNPVPEKSADDPYPELPNAAKQMEIIQKYFPADRQDVLAQQQATPAAYLNSHPEQFSYIHFVAHGEASRTDPLDSSIILSREGAANASSSQDDSFKLYARDIINNHPLHAELVTISACYSTGNRTYSGEGLVGLSWAFLYAGAHNVVAALWDVSDASAPLLIDEFYGGLKKGKSPSEALRNAKLSLLHGGTYQRPFYWAPFELYTGSKKPEFQR
jgi:CHAT domain-containing protein